MRRKKDPQTQPADPAKFWPVPGVDGEPYPPLVQEALDLVEKETLRRKRASCSHTDRMFITGTRNDYYGPRLKYRRACRDCHLVVECEHPEEAQRRERVRYHSPGNFVEFLECRCGETIAKRHQPTKPKRQTGTAWLKTEEQERREARTDRMVSRQLKRASDAIPVMLKLDHDPGTKPGAVERAMLRSIEMDLQERLRETRWTRSYQQGAMARSADNYVIRNAKGEIQYTWTETD